jgi:cell wall-associated NlpC family hydrolase
LDSSNILRPADLIFVRGSTTIAHIIEDVSRSPYSHVAGIVKPNELIEAQGGRRTGYAALDLYDGAADVYTCDSLTDAQREAVVDFAMKQQGTRYAYGLIGWEAVHFLLHIDLPYKEHGEFDCSQLWYDAYKAAGIDLCPSMKIVAPADLAQSQLLRKVGPLVAATGG